MSPIHRFARSRRCIYCGKSREELQAGELSEEHIIPLSLNGEHIIPEASCAECRELTSKIEDTIARRSMKEARAILGYKSRRPGKMPTKMTIEATVGGKKEIRAIPLADGVALVPMPIFDPPAMLRGDGSRDLRMERIQVIFVGKAPHQVLTEQRAEHFGKDVVTSPVDFAKLLVKIGYGFAVAEFGYDAVCRVPIRDLLTGAGDELGAFVGCFSPDQLIGSPSDRQHNAEWQGYLRPGKGLEDGTLVVFLRLFSHLSTPGYVVVLEPVRLRGADTNDAGSLSGPNNGLT